MMATYAASAARRAALTAAGEAFQEAEALFGRLGDEPAVAAMKSNFASVQEELRILPTRPGPRATTAAGVDAGGGVTRHQPAQSTDDKAVSRGRQKRVEIGPDRGGRPARAAAAGSEGRALHRRRDQDDFARRRPVQNGAEERALQPARVRLDTRRHRLSRGNRQRISSPISRICSSSRCRSPSAIPIWRSAAFRRPWKNTSRGSGLSVPEHEDRGALSLDAHGQGLPSVGRRPSSG